MSRFVLLLALALTGCLVPVNGSSPRPLPAPTTIDRLHIVTVSDKAAPGPEDALVNDLAYWVSVAKRGHKWTHLDIENPWAERNKAAVAKAGGPPCEILFDVSTKKVVASVKIPKDKAEQDALIAKYSKR